MYNFKPNTREPDRIIIDNFRNWVIHNGSSVWKNKNSLSDCRNIEFTIDWKIKKRLTAKLIWSDDWDTTNRVLWVGYFSWSYLRNKWWYLQKSSGSTWSNIWSFTLSNDHKQSFIQFKATQSSTVATGTATSGDYKYVKNIWWMTINTYIWKYIKINNEYKLISSNTADTIYIEGNFEKVPTTETYWIYDIEDVVFVNNDTNIYKVNSGLTTITSVKTQSWNIFIEKYENRLFYLSNWSKKLYFSELWIWDYFGWNNYIPLSDPDETMKWLKAFKDRLVIYTTKNIYYLYWDTPDNFRLEVAVRSKWCLSSKSICEWHNLQFYISNQWIENVNSIDNSTVAESLSVSDIIKDEFRTHWTLDRATWVIFDWKMYMWITNKIFVYDIESTKNLWTPIWYFQDYEEASQTAIAWVNWEWGCCEVWNNKILIWQWTQVYELYYNTWWDSGYENIPLIYIATQRLNNWDSMRSKIWRKIKLYFTPVDRVTEFKIYASFDWGSYQLLKTSNLFEIEAFFTKIATDIKVKVEIRQTWSTSTSSITEFLRLEIDYEPITKP